MTPILTEVIAAICRERDTSFYQVHDLVHQLLSEYGEADLTNRLFAEIPRDVSFEIVVDLLDTLCGSTSDNGGALHQTLEDWLREGKDNRKLRIALHCEAYPFTDADEMERVLGHLSETNAAVSYRCRFLIAERKGLIQSAIKTSS